MDIKPGGCGLGRRMSAGMRFLSETGSPCGVRKSSTAGSQSLKSPPEGGGSFLRWLVAGSIRGRSRTVGSDIMTGPKTGAGSTSEGQSPKSCSSLPVVN